MNFKNIQRGDTVTFYVKEGGIGSLRNLVSAKVISLLIFDDHVIVARGSMGTYVDDKNYVSHSSKDES